MKKKVLAAFMVMILALGMSGCGSRSATSTTESESETSIWPTDGAAGMIPTPNSNEGKVDANSTDYFWATVTNYSQDLFNEYISSIKDAGFTVDFLQYDDWFSANNEDNDYILLSYDDEEKSMDITFNVHSESESTTETITETEAPATESKTESTTEASESSDEIRPATKEALDAYETFMNDYVDFMKKYNDNPSDSEYSKNMPII